MIKSVWTYIWRKKQVFPIVIVIYKLHINFSLRFICYNEQFIIIWYTFRLRKRVVFYIIQRQLNWFQEKRRNKNMDQGIASGTKVGNWSFIASCKTSPPHPSSWCRKGGHKYLPLLEQLVLNRWFIYRHH